MFKNLQFRYKILLIPLLSAIGLVLILVLTNIFSSKNQDIIDKIVNGYAPAWEFSRDLNEDLGQIQQNLKDAVTSQDEEKLKVADLIRDEFVTRIDKQRSNQIVDQMALDDLKTSFEDYYQVAYEISSRMLRGEIGAQLNNAQATMADRYKDISGRLKDNIQRDKRDLKTSLIKAEDNNKSLTIASTVCIVVIVACLFLLTWWITKSILIPLHSLIILAEKVANGNLGVDVPDIKSNDETGILTRTFDKMVTNLKNLTIQIKDSANALATAGSEISTSVTQIAAGATETATAANETSTTVEEVRQTALDSNRKAKHVSESSQKAVQISQTGEKAVTETIDGMNRIETQMESIAESIMRLSEHGQAIGGIIATVEDVAEQSNLLAVNASIEAAKAGEHGKGFAVVAQEVKSLAEQSRQATAKVRSILDDIQKATSSAVMTTEQGSKAVEAGVIQSTEAGEAIKRLASSVAEAAQATTQIAVSSQEQLVGMDQMVSAMESIKQASTQNVSATKQVESAAHDLRELGQRLKDLVEQYQV